MPIFSPKFCKANAIFIATVDLPTPPFALETKIVNLVPLIGVLVNCLGASFSLTARSISSFFSVIIPLLLNLFLEEK